MPYRNIKEILTQAVEFHHLLEDFYLKIKDSSHKKNVKFLVDYMARHEHILEEQLKTISDEQIEEITKAWIKYEPEYATCRCFENLQITPESGVDEVVDAGLKLNQCLINLYHQMSEMALPEKVKTLFAGLEVMEVAEKKKLSRTRGM